MERASHYSGRGLETRLPNSPSAVSSNETTTSRDPYGRPHGAFTAAVRPRLARLGGGGAALRGGPGAPGAGTGWAGVGGGASLWERARGLPGGPVRRLPVERAV